MYTTETDSKEKPQLKCSKAISVELPESMAFYCRSGSPQTLYEALLKDKIELEDLILLRKLMETKQANLRDHIKTLIEDPERLMRAEYGLKKLHKKMGVVDDFIKACKDKEKKNNQEFVLREELQNITNGLKKKIVSANNVIASLEFDRKQEFVLREELQNITNGLKKKIVSANNVIASLEFDRKQDFGRRFMKSAKELLTEDLYLHLVKYTREQLENESLNTNPVQEGSPT